MGYGVQLYSISDFCDTDMDYAFSRLEEFKYESVEFAGFYGHTANEIKEMLESHKLCVAGAHVGIKELKADFEAIINFNLEIGNSNITIPCAELSTKKEVDELVDYINEIQPRLKKEGIRLSYHNHDFDLKENEDGIIPFCELEKRTDVFFQIDTYWAFIAGLDPVQTMKKYSDRLASVHIKDGRSDKTPRSLGEGIAPVRECVEYAKEHGIKMIVESEGMSPDGLSEVKRCIKYLRKLDEQ